MGVCETVRKKDDKAPDGYVVVNKEDFDSAKDEIFKEKKKSKKEDN